MIINKKRILYKTIGNRNIKNISYVFYCYISYMPISE